MIKIKMKNLLTKHLKKILIFLAFLIMIICLGVKYYLVNKQDKVDKKSDNVGIISLEKKASNSNQNISKNKTSSKTPKVFVDIKGAIVRPGVYELEKEKRVIDVVSMAGGLSDEADTTLINLAKKIEDEMVVIIYTKEQITEAKKKDLLSTTIKDSCVCPKIENDACLNNNNSSNKSSSSSKSTNKSSKETATSTDKININTASLDELQKISGIGESKAQAIIKYREENGNFNKIDDIMNVSGIGDALYEKIKDNITV